jgi:hypothetical protein
MGTIDAASLFRRIVEPGAGGGLQVHKKMKREKMPPATAVFKRAQ